jgi:hypothetical protein
MKYLIGILIVAALGFVGYKVWDYWTQTDTGKSPDGAQARAELSGESLPGIPYQLEQPLRDAKSKGPDAYKEFIDNIKKSPLVKDPRLAWIELDYVVMIASRNPAEAKRIFLKVKERTPPESQVYPRIKSLEKTFE